METKQVNEAVTELRKKLKLERIFRPKVQTLFNRMRREFTVVVAASGQAPLSSAYQSEWEALLRRQYRRTQSVFLGDVSNSLEEKSIVFRLMKQDNQDVAEITALSLAVWTEQISNEQSRIIAQTNARNMNEAVTTARQSLQEQGLDVDNRSLAAAAAGVLGRLFSRRVGSITTLATQTAAEATKQVEAQALAGERPFPLRNQPVQIPEVEEPAKLKKLWETVGDDKVRPTHISAGMGLAMQIDQIYIVGGQQLQHPGDTSLGATAKEIMNCRCSSVVSLA